MGRCRKSVDNWAPPCEGPQSRSTTTQSAERLEKTKSGAILAAVYHCRPLQTTPSRNRRDPDKTCSKEQTPSPSGVLIFRFSRLPLSILRPARAQALLRWERLIRLAIAIDLSLILTTKWDVASERALARARTLALSLEAPPFLVSSSP
eukprot:scaffold7214_cov114-Isochrysis_galbana.AAC.4